MKEKLLQNNDMRGSKWSLLYTFSYIFSILMIVTSCAQIDFFGEHRKLSNKIDLYSDPDKGDYENQLSSLSRAYLKTTSVHEVILKYSQRRYLTKIYKKIVGNNELLLTQKWHPSFHIIKAKAPFHFSLPRGQFFFSSGLIARYFKNEEILISILTYETLKSLLVIYERNLVTPLGYMTTARMIKLTQLSLKNKMELNKWSFYAIKRAGYDAFGILNWMQLKNRNALDFHMLYGDAMLLSREEYLFKNFIVKQGVINQDSISFEENSSPEFYHFMNIFKKARI